VQEIRRSADVVIGTRGEEKKKIKKKKGELRKKPMLIPSKEHLKQLTDGKGKTRKKKAGKVAPEIRLLRCENGKGCLKGGDMGELEVAREREGLKTQGRGKKRNRPCRTAPATRA